MLENTINENKVRNNLGVISSQKPLLSMAINEKLKFQNSEFEFQNKFIKSNYVSECTSQFLERNEVLVSGQLSKWQDDCKLFSQNVLASRQEVILKFVCLLNEAELRAFFNRTNSLKIKLDKLSEKYLQIQTNLVQINKHVNENSVVLYHRHFAVFLNVLYFTNPSWILFPKKVLLGGDSDTVSYENLKEIFLSETAIARISSTLKISDNFHGKGSIFDLENLKYASKKHISHSELNSLPVFCKTRINEVKNDEYQTDINSTSSDIDLITELQNCQQLLSHIENTYNLVKKLLESSLFIKFLALKNKYNDTLSESSEEDIHSELDYELTNNFAQDDFSDIEKLDNIRSSYTDMLHSSNDETELYYNPEVFLNTHANDDFKGNSVLVRALPKIQLSKSIRNGKSITYKSIITKPGEKFAFRFLDPLSDIDDEILKIQAILNRLEDKYDIIENEVFSWLQNTENSAENDFISFDKDIHDDNLNNNFYKNNDKKDNCLMRFKAGNFYDWDLDDFEFTDTKLSTLMDEETSESELDDSESSLDESYKSWQPDSRASTSSEDSDSLSLPETSYKRRNKCTKFKTDKFPGNLNAKLEANLSVTSEPRYITTRSTNVNSDHFGFVSVLLHNLQRLCNSEDIIGAKNQSVNDYILKDIKY
ncbi:uncharacterized protein TNCV_657741 [Trichonephila clavipes]|uniref:Uncharacterized protein n=1 Tax=Trichonephila clavipes TaxID=2585209 RepID=A0A8X6SZV6_TRICX|nr:uncharacterized protein TNCV_657741 [Trichonephila clavipes]